MSESLATLAYHQLLSLDSSNPFFGGARTCNDSRNGSRHFVTGSQSHQTTSSSKLRRPLSLPTDPSYHGGHSASKSPVATGITLCVHSCLPYCENNPLFCCTLRQSTSPGSPTQQSPWCGTEPRFGLPWFWPGTSLRTGVRAAPGMSLVEKSLTLLIQALQAFARDHACYFPTSKTGIVLETSLCYKPTTTAITHLRLSTAGVGSHAESVAPSGRDFWSTTVEYQVSIRESCEEERHLLWLGRMGSLKDTPLVFFTFRLWHARFGTPLVFLEIPAKVRTLLKKERKFKIKIPQ